MVWCPMTKDNLTRTFMSRHVPRSDRARQGLWSGGSRTPHARHLQNIAASTRSLIIPGALLPRGVSTTTCTSPSSVKGGKLMKVGMAKVRGVCLRRSAESAELTPQDKAISCQMVPTGATMLEYGLRFLAGGFAVAAFTALGDILRPKSFAGLFGAAPSIASATLLITLSQKGAPFVAMESRSMIVGAFALALPLQDRLSATPPRGRPPA